MIEFLRRLASDDVDVLAGERARAVTTRRCRVEALLAHLPSRFVLGDGIAAGVDVFACTAAVLLTLLCSLENVHTSLVAQLFWVGFRRELVPYERLPSPGESGWTLRRKVRYLSDSVFAFTDLPVRILWTLGLVGLILAVLVALLVLIARLAGAITVDYTPTILVLVFFASLNLLGLGIIGSYVWRAYETAKGRPGAIMRRRRAPGRGDHDDRERGLRTRARQPEADVGPRTRIWAFAHVLAGAR